MITEDYVSFEVSKLLKEKGFDEKCRYVWIFDKANDPQDTNGISKVCAEQLIDGYFIDNSDIKKVAEYGDWFEDYHKAYLCPTLQIVLKWLREVHNLCIEPYRTACGYLYTISTIPYGSCKCNPKDGGDDEDSGQWTSYEGACEAAIKYCLTNLI